MQSTFDQEYLAGLGFVGFRPLRSLPAAPGWVPTGPGIYVVTLEPAVPEFLARSVGGHFKGKDPTVPVDSLAGKWVEGAGTVYIGRATDLRRRLMLLARYGRGEPVAHQGGRYLWQLADHGQLRVAWRREDDPVLAESELLEAFESATGRLPFANLVRGTRPAVLD